MSNFWTEVFPGIEDDKIPEAAIDLMSRLLDVYDNVIKGTKNLRNQYDKEVGKIVQTTINLKESTEKLNPTMKEGRDSIEEVAKAAGFAEEKYKELNNRIQMLDAMVSQLTEEQKKYKKSVDETNKIEDQRQKLIVKLTNLQDDQSKETAKLKVEIQEKNKELKEAARESLGLVSLYEKESKRLNDLRKRYKDVALAQGRTSKEAKALKKEINQLDEELKDLDSDVGQFQRVIGGYAESLEKIGGSSAIAVDGVRSFIVSLKALLLANPVVLMISAIIGGLAVLFNLFKRTAGGSDFLAKATGFLEGILSSLVGIVDKLSIGLQAVFDDPLGSLKEFGNAILNNVINRFKAIPKLLALTGKSVSQLVKGDFSGLKETALEAGQAIAQLGTGLDVEQQKKLANNIRNFTNEIVDNVSAFTALAEARRRVRRENRLLEVSTEKLITQEEVFRSIRDDATKSFAEREAAAEQARIATEKRYQSELRLAKNNLDLLSAEVRLRRKNGEDIEDLLDEQLEAYKAFTGAEREFTLAVRENEKERAQLKQDRLEKDLDIQIDGFDNQKSINERLIADDKRVFSERRKLFEETEQLSGKAFAAQIKTIQQFTGIAIDENDLLATSDAVVLNEKIRQLGLSEIIEGRLLEVVRERRTVLQDLADIERDLTEEEIERENRRREVTQFDLDRNAERKRLISEFASFSFKSINERIQAEIDAEQFRAESLLRNEQLLAEEKEQIRKELEDKITEIQRDGLQDRQALLEQETERFSNFTTQIGGFFSALASGRTQKENEELAVRQQQTEKALENENLSSEARTAIQEKFDREQEKIQARQARRARRLAIFEKATAISQSVIETSLAVLKALRNPPGPPFSIPQAIATGAFGALRTAAIAAQPIPAFEKGTNYAPGGWAWVSEKGREIVNEPDGTTYLTGDRPEMRFIPKGSKVIPNRETEKFIDQPWGSKLLTNSIFSNILGSAKEKEINDNSTKIIQKAVQHDKSSFVRKEMKRYMSNQKTDIISAFENAISNIEVHKWYMGSREIRRDIEQGGTIKKDVKSENTYG